MQVDGYTVSKQSRSECKAREKDVGSVCGYTGTLVQYEQAVRERV